jgi:predicted O-linked N-acetylglucosamine transferase (SPINDLY family)
VLDALARGLPVIALPGDTMRSRHAAAMLRAIGLDDLICASVAQFVDAAVAYGLDRAAGIAIRRRIADGMKGLPQSAFASALAEHLIATCRAGS